MSDDKKKQLTVAESGKRGGEANYKKYGAAVYRERSRKAGLKIKERYGTEHFRQMRQKGIEKRRNIERLRKEKEEQV